MIFVTNKYSLYEEQFQNCNHKHLSVKILGIWEWNMLGLIPHRCQPQLNIGGTGWL